MSRFRTAILALPLVLAAAPALAQYGPGPGPYGPPAGPPPINSGPYYGRAPFTGLRVEGLVGYDNFRNDGSSNGVSYGVAGGYDMQWRHLVVGLEGEVADSNVRECYGDYTPYDPRFCAGLGRDLYAGGRIGAVLTPRVLVYGKAGYTNQRIGVTADNGFDRFHLGHDDLDGVRVGAGLEYNLFAGAYAKAEYRYSNYEQGYSRNQIVGGFGVRF